jgi:hypothetical protein
MTAQPIEWSGSDRFVTALIDEKDSFDEWREAADAAADAYRRWADASSDLRATRYEAYMAALNDEQSAAIMYAVAAAEVERCLDGGRG